MKESLNKEENIGNVSLAKKIKELFPTQEVLEHVPVRTSEEASKVRKTSISSQAKALMLKTEDEYMLCVFCANLKLDHKKIEAIV